MTTTLSACEIRTQIEMQADLNRIKVNKSFNWLTMTYKTDPHLYDYITTA